MNWGATARTILYVQDPDSFSHSFAFDPPPGISVQVVGEQAPREEDDAWGGHLYEVEVSADETLCPGTYSVPFTVTDPDGNSDQATLTVHVVGNQPHQASGALEGTMTVTLTPAGAVYGPVVMSIPRIWDPDGDVVYVEGYGLPPTYWLVWGQVLQSNIPRRKPPPLPGR